MMTINLLKNNPKRRRFRAAAADAAYWRTERQLLWDWALLQVPDLKFAGTYLLMLSLAYLVARMAGIF